MTDWLDLMLEKIAMRVCDEVAISTKDKEFKNAEKKKLQALIDRHDKLLPSTQVRRGGGGDGGGGGGVVGGGGGNR